MIDKETYKRELIRMFDSIRDDKYKGYKVHLEYDYDIAATCECSGVRSCEECALYGVDCGSSINAFEMIEAVEKWSKEHPLKKYKVSRMEYDILQEVYSIHGNFRMYQNEIINNLREKGYFKGSYEDTEIEDYLKSCEVDGND